MTDVPRETLEGEEQVAAFTRVNGPEPLASYSGVPISPRKVFLTARDVLGWEPMIWRTTGTVAPTLYLNGSKESASEKNQHNAGDVFSDGYTATIYCVEGRDPSTRAIGFQAFYLGKSYEDERKAPNGSFQFARIADPVGVPVKLWAEYKPIPQLRGKQEIESYYRVRLGHAAADAAQMNRDYNKRAYFWPKIHHFTAAKEFDKWLAEWASFAPKGTIL